ncbi:hypothetical protein LMG28138_04862 [Pararobbsia alpina]|uniref:Uncharacterized protein n=1 Tax=Pararobbsia alpina TaxID=621374 RepID=A0A6S7BS36_9BURK|nr:hypothetical protein LMG28138_04862 [Pararobbsia alpina]
MLVQKFHQGLRPGRRLTSIGSGNSLFSRQGTGMAAAHCIALR